MNVVDTGEMTVAADVMIAMHDGIKLATDIYRPAVNGAPLSGRFPVILERTPYGKNLASRSEVEPGSDQPMSRAEVAGFFVQRGYIVIYQDCRGRHNSEGEFIKYVSEAQDGFDTLAWIAGQDWSDGKVGTMGLSYAAHTQLALACLKPPSLATMILDSGGFANAFTCGIRQGGAFELKQATWAFKQALESPLAQKSKLTEQALLAEDILKWFQVMPWSERNSPVRWIPEYEDYLLDQWRHGTFDDYWKRVGLYAEGHYGDLAHIPVMLMSSWYDCYVKCTLDNFLGLSNAGNENVSLVMGAGLHGGRNECFAGDASFGPKAAFSGNVAPSWLEYRRRWFDRWLKGQPNDVDAKPKVQVFLMGGGTGRKVAEDRLDHGGRWISGANWPLPQSQAHVLYLQDKAGLSGTVSPLQDISRSYSFDPENPVPTIGGALTSGAPVFEGGAFNQTETEQFYGCRRPGLPLSSRSDVLTFETEPLAQDLIIAGPISVDLFVSTDGLDTDFTAKLIDVYPSNPDFPLGFSMILSDGILRCRYRHSFAQPQMCVPNEVMKITIELFATANLFKAGHRIRLDISSSNFPKFDINPNTGAPEGHVGPKRVALNTVYFDRDHPSALKMHALPVELALVS